MMVPDETKSDHFFYTYLNFKKLAQSFVHARWTRIINDTSFMILVEEFRYYQLIAQYLPNNFPFWQENGSKSALLSHS